MTTSMISQPQILTLEEYLAYDDGTDTRYELEDGVLVEMPKESPYNNEITKRLLYELMRLLPLPLIAYNIEIEVHSRQAKCRLPDLLIHSEGSQASVAGSDRSVITLEMLPPLLAIEVVSPGEQNRHRDYRYKHTEYAARGIAEYWIVDPELQQVTICKWLEGKYEDTIVTGEQIISSAVVADWQLTVNQIFQKP
ncbi:MAG: Uma2 family endonuclease [Coleofasciculaceae cyanobacterium SM2_1_6]|nr:Uma2 family endonuclease [Coleofasciculaceae cyanobacterium SM2_1_6]